MDAKRMREREEVLDRVKARFGSQSLAEAWYRSEPLAGLAGLTALQLVKQGRAAEVLEYIDAVDAGIHA